MLVLLPSTSAIVVPAALQAPTLAIARLRTLDRERKIGAANLDA
jgi:hypothetical protein